MTYNRLVIYILVCLVTFLSCKTDKKPQNTSEYNIISIDEDDFDDSKDISKIIKEIEFIQLETVKESQIGVIDLIKEYKDYYYILDRKISKSLFIFDNNGCFIKRISNAGKGPYEFTKPYFFTIDKFSNQIIICATEEHKIIKYSLLGDFEEEITLDMAPFCIEVLNESKYIVKFSGIENQVRLINKQGKQLKNIYSFDIPTHVGQFRDYIKYNEKVLYHQNFDDYIYNLTENGIEPWLYIDFKDHKITQDIIDNNIATSRFGRRRRALPSNIMSGNMRYAESDDFIYFSFAFRRKRIIHFVFYSKKTSSVVVFPGGPSSDDILYKKYHLLNNFNIMDINSKGQFIGKYNSMELIESLESIKKLVQDGFIILNGKMSKQNLKNIDVNSNPVIALYTIRNLF